MKRKTKRQGRPKTPTMKKSIARFKKECEIFDKALAREVKRLERVIKSKGKRQ